MSSGVPKVLPDANILFSKCLRDWIILLAVHGREAPYEIRWTEDIMVEALYHLRKKNPHWSDQQIGGIRTRTIKTLGVEAKIEGYEIDPDLSYEDKYDAHVHAAAVHGNVQYVVSNDRGYAEFASMRDDAMEYELRTADDFFVLVDDYHPALVERVTCQQLDYYGSRGGSYNLVTMLRNAGAAQFSTRVAMHLQSPAVAAHLSV